MASLKSLSGEPDDASVTETTSPAPISFFDSIQHQAYMDQDGQSSDSEAEQEQDVPYATYSDPQSHAQTLGRKSLSTTRPTPAFATQFRNASQPQLPVSRATTPVESTFRPIQPYDMLDRKRPLTNTPFAVSSTASNGILSQLKGKPVKSSSKPMGKKKSGVSPVVLPESTFELLRYPHGTAFSLGTGSHGGGTTGSEADSTEMGSGRLEGLRGQGSVLSLQSADAASSVGHVSSWRQEQGGQDESARKLDGMVTQHLEEERDRLRKIASAARLQKHGATSARY